MQTEATAAQADVPELDFVRKVQAGDSGAFDELVSRFRNRVFGMVYNMVHNEQDAWDLAQDSFVKAWKSIARFRGQVILLYLDLSHRDERDDRLVPQEAGQRCRRGVRRRDPIEGNRSRFRTVPNADPLPAERMEQRKFATKSNKPSRSSLRSIGP